SATRKLRGTGNALFADSRGHRVRELGGGARTVRRKFGQHGGNHPGKDRDRNVVMITAQNHGVAVDEDSLPANLRVTHKSLFDGTLQRIRRTDKPAVTFQGPPEAITRPPDAAPPCDHFTVLL
uniref:glutamine amidotransferase-related protein n=1 Tax=Salmonella enterica TaxID=28901 RepID=UPI00398C55B4